MAIDIKYEIKEMFGSLSEARGDWVKEFNLISWNGRAPKYDIREWTKDHERMGKGITLSEAEAEELYYVLKAIFDK